MSQGKPLAREARDRAVAIGRPGNRPLPPDLRAAAIQALRKGQSIYRVAQEFYISEKTATALRKEAGITTRSQNRRGKSKDAKKDPVFARLVPHLHTLRSLPFAERRAAQLKLRAAGNDPSKLHEGAA